MSTRKIYVYADWNTLEAPTLMGVLSPVYDINPDEYGIGLTG